MTASLQLIKHAHACVELRQGPHRILVDPGELGAAPDLTGCSAVLVSHGHFDHASRGLLEEVVGRGVPVFGPPDLGAVVGSEMLADGSTALHPGERRTIGGLDVEVVGGRHAQVHPELPGPQNLGYLLEGRILLTGDEHPSTRGPVDVLVTPVDAPWLRAVDLIAYVRSIRPGTVLGVHDGLLNDAGLAVADAVLRSLLTEGAGRALRLTAGEHLDLHRPGRL